MEPHLYPARRLHSSDVGNFTFHLYHVVQQVLGKRAPSICCTSAVLAGCCTPQTDPPPVQFHTRLNGLQTGELSVALTEKCLSLLVFKPCPSYLPSNCCTH
jgi:hypothetical protein